MSSTDNISVLLILLFHNKGGNENQKRFCNYKNKKREEKTNED